jgi:hypothetical protein
MRHDLTRSQAQVLSEIEQRRRLIINEWNKAVMLVGLNPDDITGGDLDSDPHFIVKDDASTP